VKSDSEEFIRRLSREFPSLLSCLEEHIEYYEELIPHNFMAACVVEFAISLFVDAQLHRPGCANTPRIRLNRFLSILEEEWMRGNADVQELIAVSFLEDLAPTPSHRGWGIREELPVVLATWLSGRDDEVDRMHRDDHPVDPEGDTQ
jgi:hypothetical protein